MGAEHDLLEDVTFGRFRFDAHAHSLSCEGKRVPLRSRSLDILRVLAAADGKLVNKDALMARVWVGVTVEENALQVHVSALRKALGESVASQRHIVTVPGRGYRFVREPVPGHASVILPVGAASPVPERPSIAVLPFQNMSGDPAHDHLADGVVEDVITALTRVPSLSVIARNSSFKYGRGPVDIRIVGRELGARYVLEGSVRKADNRLRITGQLIQAETGVHVWAEKFDGDFAHVFRLQDEITAKVVGALLPSLRAADTERAHKKPPESLDAYDLYLRALAHRHDGTRSGSDKALALLEHSLKLDPSYSDAALILGTTWALRITEGWEADSRAKSEAVRCLRLAVELDSNNAEAIATLARVIALFERDSKEAKMLAERSLALSPNSAHVQRCSGFAFVGMGEHQSGLDCLRRGLELSPRELAAHDAWSGVALALIGLGRDQEALAAARTAVQLRPRYAVALRVLASALALLGEHDEAEAVVRTILETDPKWSMAAIRARYADSYVRAAARFFDGLRLAGLPESPPP